MSTTNPIYSLGHDIASITPVEHGGHDKIIGDLHGSLRCFIRVLESLQPKDRLFLVGDLTDRGEDSPGLIQTIIDYQQKNSGGLFSVRGNHESLCLNAIVALEVLTPAFPIVASDYLSGGQSKFSDWVSMTVRAPVRDHHESDSGKYLTDVYNHVMNGGDWLISLFSQELENGSITKNADGLLEYGNISQVKMIKEFIQQLPYILYVQGKNPFKVVHADMPFDDTELLRKINQEQLDLTEIQKNHATWFRERKAHAASGEFRVENTGRNSKSDITYVGHSIIAYGDAPVIRYQTSTVDLDVATYITNVCLVADHTGGNCSFVGTDLDKVNDNSYLKTAQDELNGYLKGRLR